MKWLVLASTTILSCSLLSCVLPSPSITGLSNPATVTYPTARPHPTNKNYVIMPWRPHNAVDVKNFKPGQLGRDPYTALVNPKTGKRDNNTGKIFRVPTPPVVQATAPLQN